MKYQLSCKMDNWNSCLIKKYKNSPTCLGETGLKWCKLEYIAEGFQKMNLLFGKIFNVVKCCHKTLTWICDTLKRRKVFTKSIKRRSYTQGTNHSTTRNNGMYKRILITHGSQSTNYSSHQKCPLQKRLKCQTW